MNSKVLSLAMGNIKNKVAEHMFLWTGIDFTRPVQVYGLVNERCNARCIMCNSWRSEDDVQLPAEDWNRALSGLKAFSSGFNINFSGGEPLLKKDFYDVLEFCSKNRIIAGFTTNGLLLNEKNVDRIFQYELFNVNVSIDSLQPSVHDQLRGVPGMLKRVKSNIEYLCKIKKELKKDVRIIVKPIVFKDNLNELADIVRYCKSIGVTAVNFQPVFKWSRESETMFNVDLNELQKATDQILELKEEGYPIMNSKNAILQWTDHFKGNVPKRTGPCFVALRNLTIHADGSVKLCGFCDSAIGNIKDQTIKQMWKSKKARVLRKALVRCKRHCTATCVVKRSLKDYVDLFMKLVRG